MGRGKKSGVDPGHVPFGAEATNARSRCPHLGRGVFELGNLVEIRCIDDALLYTYIY